MGVISTQAFTFRLLAGTPYQQLDLFSDEDYLISNNVTGLFDIGLQPADFTRQITIPGTKVNNEFFEHYYDISIQNPFLFSTSNKVPAFFEFDSLYLSQGYIQLNKVNVIANKFIDSYEITLYGTISSFGRDLNTLFLNNLTTLSKYNHTSSYDNISSSWSGGLFSGDIVYPLADYGAGWRFSNDRGLLGINSNEGAMTTQDFKPAIRVKAVLDAIFEQTGYTYSSSFFNQPFIQDMYMVCNTALKYPEYSGVDLETFGVAKIGAIPSSSGFAGQCDYTLTNATVTPLPWYNVLEDPQGVIGANAAYTVLKSSKVEGTLNLALSVSNSVNNLPSSWELHYWPTGSTPGGAGSGYSVIPTFSSYFDQLQASRNGSINTTVELATTFYTSFLTAGTYYFGLKQTKNLSSNAPTVKMDPNNENKSFFNISKVRQAADGRVIDIPLNMPYGTKGIKLVDFLTGLQRKFNLVMYPNRTKPNEFIIETFNNWYRTGGIKDFNKYINLNEPITVTPANNLAVNNLNFGDTLDTDYVSQQFFKGANREYGKTYYIDTQNFFSQGTLNVETTFASSPLLRIAGTGLSGSVGGINPPITQYSAGTYRFTNSNGARYACSSPISFEIFTSDGTITSGRTAYYDPYGNTAVTGYYFFSDNLDIYHINNSTGVIGNFATICSR